jgi:hypothetical protein
MECIVQPVTCPLMCADARPLSASPNPRYSINCRLRPERKVYIWYVGMTVPIGRNRALPLTDSKTRQEIRRVGREDSGLFVVIPQNHIR